MKKQLRLVVLSILCSMQVAWAQNKGTLTGTVKASDGLTLPGVSILEKGTTNGAITDVDGKYSISVSSSATLVFSYVGMIAQELAGWQ